MLLHEIWEPQAPGYYDGRDDKSAACLEYKRRSQLTLADIRKLRRLNDIRNIDRKRKLDQLQSQYRYIPPKL